MSRKIIDAMEEIFNVLKSSVSEDDSGRILNIKRHIKAQGNEADTCGLVSAAKFRSYPCGNQHICLFDHKGDRYLLAQEEHLHTLGEIGFSQVNDISIIQGAGMLAISEHKLSIRESVNSLQIIKHCLGISPEEIDGDSVTFDFSSLVDMFEPYGVVSLDDSVFPLMYEEDINRLICYLQIETMSDFENATNSNLKNLLLLNSTRTIAASIQNSIQCPLIEYSYLQLYQCIEYLFKLNYSISLAANHCLTLEKSIDIILGIELKYSEQENLYQVLKCNASEMSIDSMISAIPNLVGDVVDKFKTASQHIYKLRCNVAHLRYNQDDLSSYNWKKCIDALIEIILSIYEKLDSQITQICTSKSTWKAIML